uniref:Integrase SAM-like N-terminal domain-containing protein n=1 Tax=Trichogramma kaykai TaxID=54128 RepID=A0ABD2WG50_9HYME
METGVFPSSWKRQRLVLLPKPGKPPDEPSSYRPLSAFLRRDIPVEALDIMFASLAKSTLKQYCSALKQWIEFCETKPIPYSDTSSFNVLTFLSDRFKNGASYSTLKTMRSALSLISSNKVGELSYVSRFMKGVYKLRPTKPKYEFTWDTSIVLNKLETIDCTDIKILTYKTIMLLALGTAQRAQTLSLIKLSNITPVARGLEIRIPDIIKTSASERNQPLLQIPFFPEKPGVCIASSLIEYINRTKNIRSGRDKLFISLCKPYKEVSSETISRWIKDC